MNKDKVKLRKLMSEQTALMLPYQTLVLKEYRYYLEISVEYLK